MERLIEFLLYLQGPVPYLVAFLVLLACGFGAPIPEDLTLFAMGLLSYYGLVDIKTSILICFAGVMIGDTIVFMFGKYYGERITRKGFVKKIFTPERMVKTQELFRKWGNKVIFLARFMPGLRTPMFFSAGTFKTPMKVFLFYDGLAALLSVPLLIGSVYYFGDQVDKVIQVARKIQNGIVLLVAAIVLFFVIKHYIMKRRAKRNAAV